MLTTTNVVRAHHKLFTFGPPFRRGAEVLLLFAGWRIIVLFISVVASQFGPQPPDTAIDLLGRSLDRWDAGWYQAIARDGYSGTIDGNTGHGNVAFYPLLPLLLKLAYTVLPSWRLSGALVVHFALLGALLYAYAIARLDYDLATARRFIIAILLFPTAVFLTAIYTESLLLLTITASVYHARRGQWLLAGIWGAAAGLTKMPGAVVLVPLLWEYWRSKAWRGPDRRRIIGQLAALALVPLGALAFLGYLQLHFGTYQTYFTVQQGWHRGTRFAPFFPDGWNFLLAYFNGTSEQLINYFYPQGATTLPTTTTFMVIDLLFLLFGIIFGIVLLWRVRITYGLLVLAGLFMTAYSGSPQSINRYTIIFFPIPLLLALAARRPAVGFFLFMAGAFLMTIHVYFFVNGYWAG